MPFETNEPPKLPDLYEASILELQDGLNEGLFTSVDLVKAYLARIEEVNRQGPELRAVIETNPSAIMQAKELDSERKTSSARGPLHGIPILVKDNMATIHSEGMNTTAGSYALLGSVVPRDAHVIAQLRLAGAIILGKANTSEWANFRGRIPSGFSGRGGQSSNPYVHLGDPSGSSTGSGIGMAIGLAAGSLGSETDGSIVSPSERNNLVGIKPTVGLTSRAGVIPISIHQDTVGPMCRSVSDAAVLLTAISGKDPRDPWTLEQPEVIPDHLKALDPDALKGVRVGVPRALFRRMKENVVATFDAALEVIRSLGATVVDPADIPATEEYLASANRVEDIVLMADFKVDIANYLAELVEVPTGVKTLADLIAFNEANADKELIPPYWDSQSKFIQSEASEQDLTYRDALESSIKLGRTEGIDGALKAFNLTALLMPTNTSSQIAAIAGYPIVTVPLGFHPSDTLLAEAKPTRSIGPNMPFGISFIGTAWSEFELISYAYAYEQATHIRLKQLALPEAIPRTQLIDVIGK